MCCFGGGGHRKYQGVAQRVGATRYWVKTYGSQVLVSSKVRGACGGPRDRDL